jgi:hypothetical protein
MNLLKNPVVTMLSGSWASILRLFFEKGVVRIYISSFNCGDVGLDVCMPLATEQEVFSIVQSPTNLVTILTLRVQVVRSLYE